MYGVKKSEFVECMAHKKVSFSSLWRLKTEFMEFKKVSLLSLV